MLPKGRLIFREQLHRNKLQLTTHSDNDLYNNRMIVLCKINFTVYNNNMMYVHHLRSLLNNFEHNALHVYLSVHGNCLDVTLARSNPL